MLFSILHCASRHHRELSAVLGFEGKLKEWVRPEGKEVGEARWPGSDHGGRVWWVLLLDELKVMVKGFNRGVTGFDLYFERSHRLLCGEWMVGG